MLPYCSTEAGQRSTTEPCLAVHMIFDVETDTCLHREAKNWVTHGLGSLGFISATSVPAQSYPRRYILCSLSVPSSPPPPRPMHKGTMFFSVHKQLITWFSCFFTQLTAIRLFQDWLIFVEVRKMYQLDANNYTMIFSHKWPLHVSDIYMSIFRSSYI